MLGFASANLNASENEVCEHDLDNYVLISQNKISQNENDKLQIITVKNGEIIETRLSKKRDSKDFIQGIKRTDLHWSIGKPTGISKLFILKDLPEYEIYKTGKIKLKGHFDLSKTEQDLILAKEHSFTFKGVGFEICSE
jgi:hypothetical protein